MRYGFRLTRDFAKRRKERLTESHLFHFPAQDVLVGRVQENSQNQRESDRMSDLHRAAADGTANQAFDRVEQHMSTIQNRNGEEIKESEACRDNGNEVDHIGDAL